MSDLDIRLLIEAALKDKGLVDLRTRLDSVEKQVKKTRAATDRLGKSFKQFGKYVAGFFAVGVIARFGSSSVKEFARVERSINATRLTMVKLGLDADAELPGVVSHLERIRDAGGPLLSETIPIFQKFIGITKDTNEAMFATKLAADASESGLADARTAGEALANIMQGEATEAAKRLGVELVKQNGQIKTNAELFTEVIALYKGLGEQTDDATTELSKNRATWESIRLELGKKLAPAIHWVGTALRWLVNIVETVGAAIGGFVASWTQLFRGFGKTLVAIFDFRKLIKEGPREFFRAIRDAAEETLRHSMNTWRGAGEEIRDIWRENGETAAMSFEDGWDGVVEQAGRRAAAQDRANQGRRVEEMRKWGAEQARAFFEGQRAERERALAEFEEEQERMIERLERERTFRNTMAQELAQINIEAAETAAEQREAELAALEVEEEQRLDYAVRNNEDVAKVVEFYRKKRLLVNRRYDQAEAELDAARRAHREELYLQTAQLAVNALTSIFGQHKALAIAQALINTYEGATKALAQGGIFGPFWAALVIAQGLAQVQQIRSTEPTGGFGGFRGGGMHHGTVAFAATALPAAGAATGEGGAPGQTTNIAGDTININATVIDERAIKHLGRRLDQAKRRDRASRVMQ